MSADYAAEKFSRAVDALAAGPDRIKERLIDAYSREASLAYPPSGVSAPLARRIEELHSNMTNKSAQGGEGAIRATVEAMSDEKASRLAQEIVSLAQEIEEEIRDSRK